MTIRNLDAVFEPDSVAVIGASQRPGSLGSIVFDHLRAQFSGPVYPVNPKYRRLQGAKVYRRVAALPAPADLAVIVTPARTVPGLIAELAQAGTRGACVITAGTGQRGDGSFADWSQAMLDAARPGLLRIVGPNCLGIQVPRLGLNASFAQLSPGPGGIAFVAQSGAMIATVLDWAQPRGIGFSHTVSLGDMIDVDFGDMLDYLANRPETTAILLYIETITHARKFMSAARAAARMKPVIVVKAGRSDAGARAAGSHTGALAGTDAVYDAAFRRAGILRVVALEELFDAVETLSLARTPDGDRLAILTNGGGLGVLAADAYAAAGGTLARLSDTTMKRLDAVLPPSWSHGNPVDIVGDATGERYADAIEALLEEPDCDGLLILNCPTAVGSPDEAAAAAARVLRTRSEKTVVTSWVGSASVAKARASLREHGIPTYESPEDAAHAFSHMVSYARNQGQLMETPPSLPEQFEPDHDAARAQIDAALEDRREWMTDAEASRLLEAYGIPTVPTHTAASPAAVGECARQIGGAVAIKILSADITHKSDVGGVLLDIEPESAEHAAAKLAQRVKQLVPEARIAGFTVQPMIRRPLAHELIAGMTEDRQFGPVLLFGHGGTAVEIIDDKALALPPLNLKLAHELISRTRVSRLLEGYRNVPRANLLAVEMALVRLSHLVTDFAEIRELDINPLLADADGIVALDMRVRVAPATAEAAQRLAIRPYPRELEQTVELDGAQSFFLRPILPEDEPSLRAAFHKLTTEEIRFRFFTPLKLLDHLMAARFTQIDYDRQMALVLTARGIPGKTEISGVVRLMEDPDRTHAEFAVAVAHDLSGRGLGTFLVRRILEYARTRGIGEVYGDVLRDNERMLTLCRRLGFATASEPGEPGVVRVTIDPRAVVPPKPA